MSLFLSNLFYLGVGAAADGSNSFKGESTTSNFDIGTLLQNATNTGKAWGNWLLILLGVVLVVYAGWQIATGFMSHGKKQTNWFIVATALVVGGAFMVGGFGFLQNIAAGGKKTIDQLGNGGDGISKNAGTNGAGVIVLGAPDGADSGTIIELP